jgi:NRPS condensation-like uncharacterized protein
MTHKLNSYDSFFWLLGRQHPFIIQYSIRLEGSLQKAFMVQALQLLQRQHPILQHTVTKHRPFVFKATRKPIPLFIHPRKQPDNVEKVASAALRKPMPLGPGDPVLRVDWVRGTTTHDVIFSIEHAFSDFRSMVGLASDLLGFLDRLHGGQRDIKLNFYPWYPELKTLLPRHKPELAPPELVVPFRDDTPLAAKPPFQFNASCSHLLSLEESRTIVTLAKENSCTVQGVLCAAMIHTLNAYATEHRLGSESFCFTPCDLRAVLNAHMTGKELGNFVTGIFHPFKIGAQKAFWRLAADISEQIKTTIDSDLFTRDTEALSGLYHARMTSQQAMQIMKARECCGFVSNAGLVPFADHYQHFALQRVRVGVASPIMSGRAHLFWLSAQTIRGQMQLELLDTGIGDQREKFARFMRKFLDVLFCHGPQQATA